jgi:hypothetical protein
LRESLLAIIKPRPHLGSNSPIKVHRTHVTILRFDSFASSESEEGHFNYCPADTNVCSYVSGK